MVLAVCLASRWKIKRKMMIKRKKSEYVFKTNLSFLWVSATQKQARNTTWKVGKQRNHWRKPHSAAFFRHDIVIVCELQTYLEIIENARSLSHTVRGNMLKYVKSLCTVMLCNSRVIVRVGIVVHLHGVCVILPQQKNYMTLFMYWSINNSQVKFRFFNSDL